MGFAWEVLGREMCGVAKASRLLRDGWNGEDSAASGFSLLLSGLELDAVLEIDNFNTLKRFRDAWSAERGRSWSFEHDPELGDVAAGFSGTPQNFGRRWSTSTWSKVSEHVLKFLTTRAPYLLADTAGLGILPSR